MWRSLLETRAQWPWVLGALLLVGGAIAWHAWRQKGDGPWLRPDLLAATRQANPRLQIESEWIEVVGTRGSPVRVELLHVSDGTGRRHVLPADEVGGARLALVDCADRVPLPPGARARECTHAQPAGLAPRWWISFEHDDPAAVAAFASAWAEAGRPGQLGTPRRFGARYHLSWLPPA